MNNTDFFRVRTFSLNPTASRPTTKDQLPIKPRTVLSTKKGIQSLLEGSIKSHCNTFVGYSRIPHKYDHFHDKTISSSTAASFLHSASPRKVEPQKNLLSLAESLDISQARVFFNRQQVFKNILEINKFTHIKSHGRRIKSEKSPNRYYNK